jgi:hypothetical protein
VFSVSSSFSRLASDTVKPPLAAPP